MVFLLLLIWNLGNWVHILSDMAHATRFDQFYNSGTFHTFLTKPHHCISTSLFFKQYITTVNDHIQKEISKKNKDKMIILCFTCIKGLFRFLQFTGCCHLPLFKSLVFDASKRLMIFELKNKSDTAHSSVVLKQNWGISAPWWFIGWNVFRS